MKQVRQFLGSGTLEVGDVPLPAVGPGDILVRTHFSFVSVGTERMKVTQARMNLAEKARERPDQVRQVLQTLREQGPMATWRKIQERLKAPTPLGYSCAGTVVGVGERVADFRVGDRVAAIGEGLATHAEYNSVPVNLVVHVPASVALDQASATAVGAIALQGVRQAGLELGETVAVIGLGLLGQFLVQALARANGCRVIGVDVDPAKCTLAVRNGAEAACGPQGVDALTHALRVSGGAGVDAVLVTASTEGNQPIELAAELVRDRGRVVCLGNTHIELDWRTWFGKEIDFRFSRAMGAGMYDPDYLMRGKDYPVGYVRWTANRNMGAFLDLVEQGRVDVSGLITHRVPLGDAVGLFDRIASGELAGAVGIVLEYPQGAVDLQAVEIPDAPRPRVRAPGEPGVVRFGVIGAGNYLKSMILPALATLPGARLAAICTARGMNADALASRYGFGRALTDSAELIADPAVDAVMVATRHDSHARLTLEALRAGKHVYVEKPLAMTSAELEPILDQLSQGGPSLWVGHNRRFSPFSRRALEHMHDVERRQVACTVRSAGVPADSWYQDATEGGGLLFGDVCHFIDLALAFQRSAPVEVHAFTTRDPGRREESWAIQIQFENGSLSTVHYVCGSERGWDREVIDVLGGGRSARISGFKRLVLNGGAGGGLRRLEPDLGQRDMLVAMLNQFSGRGPDQSRSFIASAQALLAAHRSIQERRAVSLEPRYPFSPR